MIWLNLFVWFTYTLSLGDIQRLQLLKGRTTLVSLINVTPLMQRQLIWQSSVWVARHGAQFNANFLLASWYVLQFISWTPIWVFHAGMLQGIIWRFFKVHVSSNPALSVWHKKVQLTTVQCVSWCSKCVVRSHTVFSRMFKYIISNQNTLWYIF